MERAGKTRPNNAFDLNSRRSTGSNEIEINSEFII